MSMHAKALAISRSAKKEMIWFLVLISCSEPVVASAFRNTNGQLLSLNGSNVKTTKNTSVFCMKNTGNGRNARAHQLLKVMSLKNLKLITLKRNPSLSEGYQLFHIADKWAELLPERVPLHYSLFRYLGFYVTYTTNGKSMVVKSRSVAALRVTIQNEDKVVFSERVSTAFPNGVYYVQDIRLEHAGVHTVYVTVEGELADEIAPLVLKTQVFEFMELHECPDLQNGVYQPLREFVFNCIKNGHREKLRNESFLEAYVRTTKHSLRNMDARWWLKAFIEHTLDREERQKLLQINAAMHSCRTTHKRKQAHPSRTADKKEYDNLFARRKRDWKRVRAGDVRMFTIEPLHAGATTTVYSKREMFRQLSLYAQI